MMPQNRCSKCKENAFAEGICELCYLEKHPLLLKFKELDIEICPACSRYFGEGKWHKARECADAIQKAIKGRLYLDKSVRDIEIAGISPGKKLNPGMNIKGTADVTLHGLAYGKSVKDKYSIPFTVLLKPCNNCRKASSQYFEGVLQIRNAKKDDPIYAYVRNQISKLGREGVFITKEASEKDGKDFYITSKRFMRTLAEKLVSEFGGELQTTSRLFSRDTQTSKNIYRISILLTLPDYRKGDAIKVADKIIMISAVGKKLTGTELHTGKRISIEAKNLHGIELLATTKAQLVRTKPTVEVLHPVTFQSIIVKNPETLSKEAKAGDEVAVAYDDDIVVLC